MKISCLALLMSGMLLVAVGCRGDGAPELTLKESIDRVVEAADEEDVARFYSQRNHRPAWINLEDDKTPLTEAVSLLCQSSRHGLNPADYMDPALKKKVIRAYDVEHESDSVRVRRLAELDVAVTKRLLELTDDMVTGRIDPKSLGNTWKTPVHDVDHVKLVASAAQNTDPSIIANKITGAHDQYAKLVDALAKYRAIRQSGGFPTVESGASLSAGDSSEQVATLRRRLAASGDLDSTAASSSSMTYDEDLAEAVRSFQERHGLEVDGVVGESVIEAMNVGIDRRIEEIEHNLERWRWIPEHLGGRYVYVNIPAFQLRAFDQGKEVLQSKVVVGEEYDARTTPVFSDTMEYVVVNPYWNIPQSIASEEIIPKAQGNPSYLAANDYEIVTGWGQGADVVSSSPENLELAAAGEYRLRQKPGPENALGRIKFMFPNQFNIYLHDTPADYLFDRAHRAYSHGCIRVEREIDLAEFVFQGENWSEDRIERMIESREHQTVNLEQRVPVYILYWTSFVDGDGRVHFRDDIYGHGQALEEALTKQAPESAPVSCQDLISVIESKSS